MSLERAADRFLGSRPLVAAAEAMQPNRLRILAYHAVKDVISFRRQMEYVADRYRTISSDDVVDCLELGRPLPRRSIWVTFDDGDPSVVSAGLPILQQLEIPGTVFICPGLVGTSEPFWWELVALAVERGATPEALEGIPLPQVLARLKELPDEERRELVAGMRSHLVSRGEEFQRPHLQLSDLHRWLAAGCSVGNHTWDHPCLDTCTVDDQIEQIGAAHVWLSENLGQVPRLFAYPNGNHAATSERYLAELGYAAGLLFDHRFAATGRQPLRLSRLRVNDNATTERLAAIASGVHGPLMRLRSRFR